MARDDSFDLDEEILIALADDDKDLEASDYELSAKRHKSSERQSKHVGGAASKPKAVPIRKCGKFYDLPEDVVLHIVAHLSASSLAALAQTCKAFSDMSRGDDLWKPLFVARWPGVAQECTLSNTTSWKELYVERDRRGLATIWQTQKEPWLKHYIAMEVAKRDTITVSPHLRHAPLPFEVLLQRVARWRTMKGLTRCANTHIGSKHGACSQQGPYCALGGGLFACETCGWAHLCGDSCSEKLVDEPSELLVCPDDTRDVQEEAACDFGVAGHWGRAYSEGYNCMSEEELRYKCGVVK